MMALWKKMALPPISKRKLGPPTQKVPKKFEIFPVPSYKTWKKIWWVEGEGVYTMENKDTNTD